MKSHWLLMPLSVMMSLLIVTWVLAKALFGLVHLLVVSRLLEPVLTVAEQGGVAFEQ
ncbi:hypothetical protein AAGW04_18305 [Pectobacterium aroidearum]|uniref:hypothetical protein n=1 Tax=Pectobacterium aroidearum TaxID=1201031 RepID=UPI00315993AD